MTVGDFYDGGTVNLAPGDTLEVKLAPVPGCAWAPAFGDATVLKPDAEGAGPSAFRFRAAIPGSASLGFVCRNAADPRAAPGGLFRVAAVVKEMVLPRGLLLEQPDNASAIYLVKGDLLQVRLPATPSTGYSWTIASNAPSVLLPLGDPKFDPPSKPTPGAAGTVTFDFRVVGGGGAFLELVYARPSEKDAAPARRWGVFVAAAAVAP